MHCVLNIKIYLIIVLFDSIMFKLFYMHKTKLKPPVLKNKMALKTV